MSDQQSESNNKKTAELVRYYSTGRHAFVACSEPAKEDAVSSLILDNLAEELVYLVDCSKIEEIGQFVNEVGDGLNSLLGEIGAQPCRGRRTFSSQIADSICGFRNHGSQGFLLINHIDKVIEMQNTYEIEGAFREAMQHHDDIAILWLGSRNTIIDINQDDRPFYLSFRIFWI